MTDAEKSPALKLDLSSAALNSRPEPLTATQKVSEAGHGATEKQLQPRRLSESGLPSGPKSSRLSSGGTPRQAQQTPRSMAASRSSEPKITPRETRSSTLRRSMGSSDGTSLRAAVAAMKDSSTPGAVGSELSRLNNDLRAKQKEVSELENSAANLKASLEAKERALSKTVANTETLKARVIQAEGDLSKKTVDCRRLEVERNKLQSKVQDLQHETDKLRRKLEAMPKGTGLSEAIAMLEGKVETLKATNGKLEHENKAVQNQLRAKDKELDTMALEVAAAREILVQNGQLENYILDLRKQLSEAEEERTTLLHVQRQMKAEVQKMNEHTNDARQEAADTRRELTLCKQQLKSSEENAEELNKEMDLRRKELKRVGAVAAKASAREASNIREEGMVPFELHKEEVMHLRGENTRVKDKLRLAEKANAAQQRELEELFKKLDILESKTKAKASNGIRAKTATGRTNSEHAVNEENAPIN